MNPKRHRKHNEAGFTLVEIMVVVVILGLLAGVGAVAFHKIQQDATEKIAAAKCADIQNALQIWVNTHPGEELSNDDILEKLVEEKKIDRDDLKDPWGQAYYVIEDEDGDPIVCSSGKDKQRDNEDDIWKKGKLAEKSN